MFVSAFSNCSILHDLTFVCIFQIKIPKGIPAGGIRISVSGKNLAYIQNPQMYVYYKDKMFGSVSK
jgi:hypothetical protein